MKDVKESSNAAAGLEIEFTVLDGPAPSVELLVLPLLRITDARLGLHVVVPDILRTATAGPNVLARNAARMAADAFVKVHDHGELRFNLHTTPPHALSLQ